MSIKVVIGANYGDEGKGMTSYYLSKQSDKEVVNILYNGGPQRGHTADNHVWHCFGAGSKFASSLYWNTFMVNPVAIMNERESFYNSPYYNTLKLSINKECLVTLPHDVILNRIKEDIKRKSNSQNGSCGMGIWETYKRSLRNPIYYKELSNPNKLYKKIKQLEKDYYNPYLKYFNNFYQRKFYESLNLDDFFIASKDCQSFSNKVNKISNINLEKTNIIFEAGQGLMLDKDFNAPPTSLTPSSTGLEYLKNYLNSIPNSVDLEICYVTRSYMTRHGKGPMEQECKREELNLHIVDNTNVYNTYQGNFRYGLIYVPSLIKRIEEDFKKLNRKATKTLVVTHMNYTSNNKIFNSFTKKDSVEIFKPYFDRVLLSYSPDNIEEEI